jgi:hypothetical protein
MFKLAIHRRLNLFIRFWPRRAKGPWYFVYQAQFLPPPQCRLTKAMDCIRWWTTMIYKDMTTERGKKL